MTVREIVLDTETTGLDPDGGHRLVELGGVELINHLPTGRVFHTYLNPMRDVPPESVRVHGLTAEFLKDHPLFAEKVEDFLSFLGESTLVIHNAEFDMKFINAELKGAGFRGLSMTRVVDTLALARKKFPGQPANLDALCRRFKIDNSGRTLHGALLDSQLLAEVYLELVGGRQHGMAFGGAEAAGVELTAKVKRQKRPARSFPISGEEEAAHRALLESIKGTLWGE